ncbi:hypothetical protein DL768_001678 [Monosporascus sp. mg162]|nr:hypothetical protein DL768_001678 [Monosporascus sp. mg162]
MTDITPIFNGILKSHEAPPLSNRSFSVDNLDDFLQEAYKISYLSAAQPRRHLIRSTHNGQQSRPLSDREREEVDAQMKQMLRTLNGSIRNMADAEQVRHETALTLINKKYGRGLNFARAWAAGGGPSGKSAEHVAAEERETTISTHRESILWFLRQRLQECVEAQQNMMEIRITREMEKSRSVLAKAQGPDIASLRSTYESSSSADYKATASSQAVSQEVTPSYNPVEGLTQEQVQMFEQDNKEMLKHYESTLDQVRTAQKSLIEISELQTQLVDNLATQSAHIDSLVADSMHTTENIGGGNKQLKKATQKPSPAKYTFFATTIDCATSFTIDVVPQAPEDPLFGLMRAYKADQDPNKVDLGIGAYRDDNAKPWVLPVVKKADEVLRNDPELNHEYAPIAGIPSFTSKAAELILGADSPAIKEKRATSIQTISGTGAVHLGALFLSRFYPGTKKVYLSNPTWANHNQIFTNVGIPITQYPYFSKETKGLDFEGMKSALLGAPDRSIILLHACAHNPTGVDPTLAQWKEIAAIMRQKSHFPFFDTAYQGFASGDLSKDNAAVRYFVEQGFELVVAQSFAKNFGLYGERAGCFHIVTSPAPDAENTISRIASQLAILQRSEISNPPLYGARIASTVMNDASLFAEWEDNLRTMSGRIISMRKALRSKLEELGTPGTWNHITDQIGMFSFTGLTEAQVLKIREDAHIYMTKNGRISMAGLNTKNVDYVAKAIDKVVREVQ